MPYQRPNTSALIKPNIACLSGLWQQWPLLLLNTRWSTWFVFGTMFHENIMFGCQSPTSHNWMLIWEQRSTVEKQIHVSHLMLSLVHWVEEWVEQLTLYYFSLSLFLAACGWIYRTLLQQCIYLTNCSNCSRIIKSTSYFLFFFFLNPELSTLLATGQRSLNPYWTNESKYGIPHPDQNMEIACYIALSSMVLFIDCIFPGQTLPWD